MTCLTQEGNCRMSHSLVEGKGDIHERSWHLWSGHPTDISFLSCFCQSTIPLLMTERLSTHLLKCFSSLAHEKFNVMFKTNNCFMNILSPTCSWIWISYFKSSIINMLTVSHTTFFWKQIGHNSRILRWATSCRMTTVLIIMQVIFLIQIY